MVYSLVFSYMFSESFFISPILDLRPSLAQVVMIRSTRSLSVTGERSKPYLSAVTHLFWVTRLSFGFLLAIQVAS